MIVGIDEVGRGCWAGPLVAGAVVLRHDIKGLRDSKIITSKKREQLAEDIQASAIYSLGWVSPQEIDQIGLTQAVRLAMQRAITEIDPTQYSEIIIDGSYNFLSDVQDKRIRAVVRADGSIPAVSAASIIAKVARDTYMKTLGPAYEKYAFSSHVGYGTAKHRQALERYGVTDIHRRSFKPIRSLMSKKVKL